MKLSVLSRLQKQTPGQVLMVGLFSGSILVLLSFLLGIALVEESPGGKLVGYAAAPNWSLTFVIAFPLFGYFVTRVLRGTGGALGKLAPMLVENDGSRATDGANRISGIHKRFVRSWSAWADALFAICVIASWIEWFAFSLGPLLGVVKVSERDWSVALNGQGAAMEALNAAFALLAFTMQGVWAGIFFAYIAYLLAFEATVSELTDRKKPPHLVPDFDINDERGGFGRLGVLIESMLSAFAAVYIALWFSRLQNLFLRSSSTTAMDMFLSEWRESLSEPTQVLDWIFAGWRDAGDYSSVAVILGALLVLLISVGMPLFSLRNCALASQLHAHELLSGSWAPKGHTPDEAKQILSKMKVFPILYPSIKQLIALAALALAALVFFRLGTVLFVCAALALLTNVMKTLKGEVKEATEQQGADLDEVGG